MIPEKRSDMVLKNLRLAGALLDGHFVLRSGRHSDQYVNKDALYPYPWLMCEIGLVLADAAISFWPDEHYLVVLGPEKGGIILAQWAAWGLCQTSRLLPLHRTEKAVAVYAEKKDDGFVVQRGMDQLLSGQRVLVVEDVVTTGGSISKVAELVPRYGGTLIGGLCLVNRGGVQLPWLKALVEMNITSWAAADCPSCRDGIPINENVGAAKR